MPVLRDAGLPLLAHAELELGGAASHGGDPRAYAGYLRSRPAAWEDAAIALLIKLARETGCAVHVVHLSSAASLEQIARAKADGLHVTAETCPHYLCLEAESVPDGATEYKCAPPIRDHENREALWRGLKDGVIDFVVSDHSPCTPALKGRERGDFAEAWGGIASLQLGLPAVWTEASRRGHSLGEIASWMSARPAALAGLGRRKGQIAPGFDADLRGLGSGGRVRGRRRAAPLPSQGLALPGPAAHGARRGDVPPRATGLRWERSSGRPGRCADPGAGHPRMSQPSNPPAATFSGLVDLAAAELGGRALGASDDFFAGGEQPAAARARRLHRGEVHRARQVDGRLGEPSQAPSGRQTGTTGASWRWARPGEVVGFDIDTQHFVGNHPPFASVDGLWAPDAAAGAAAAGAAGARGLGRRCSSSRRCGPTRRTCSRPRRAAR